MTYTYKLSRRLASSHDMIRTLRPLILLLLMLLATACGTGELANPHTPDTERAMPGWISLSLTTPRTDDGAVQMSVLGRAMDSLQLSAVGGVARMWVPDTRKTSIYVATVDQAAAWGTYQLQDLSQGYAAKVTR